MKKIINGLLSENLKNTRIKKYLVFPLLLVLICFSFTIFSEDVSADTLRYKQCISKTSTYGKYTKYSGKYSSAGHVMAYANQDNRIVFCIEQGVPRIKSGGRSFKTYKLGDSMLNKGIGYATWYVDSDAKASVSCSNRRMGGQIFTHMIAYRANKGGSCSTCDLLSPNLTDARLNSRVKSMISTSSSNETAIASHVVQIRTLFNAHGKKLAFKSYNSSVALNKFDSCVHNDNDTYTCKKVLLETTGLLVKIQALSDSRFRYSVTDVTSGTTVSRSSNKITVTSVIPASKIDSAVKFSFTRTSLSNNSSIRKSIIGGNVQDMAYSYTPSEYKDKSTVSLYADIEKTKINVKKTLSTTGETLDGIDLYLYDDSACTVRSKNYQGQVFPAQKTAGGGLATWDGIIKDETSTYYVGENESKEYEKLCVPVQTKEYSEPVEKISPSSTTAEYVNTVKNIPKGVGTVEIQKTNTYSNTPLRGMLFGIYSDSDCQTSAADADGKELEESYTDENGIVKWENIPYPSALDSEKIYYVKEIFSNESDTAGNGFAIDRKASIYAKAKKYCIPVALKEKNKEFVKDNKKVLKINNHPYGNVTVLKQDDKTGSSVKGAVFAIYKTDGKTRAVDVDGKTIPSSKTDSAGIAKFENVPYGKYILREIQTPTGYKKLSKDLTFTLDDNLNSIQYQGQKLIGVNVEQSKTSYKLGDIDEDEQITNKDLSYLKEWVEKISKSESVVISATQRYAADVNEDGILNQADVDLMEDYVNNNNKLAFKALKHGVFILGDQVYALGDPNNDETIDEKDLEIAKKIYLGETTEYKDTEYYACDLNNDGTLDSQDIDLFEIYLGTGKIEEELAPQLAVDLTKIDYNKDGKKDLKDVFFLKGVVFGKGAELSDGFTYDLNEDGKLTTEDLDILDNYISNIGKEKAFNVIGMSDTEYTNTINKIYEYQGKEIVDEPVTEPGTEENTESSTEEETTEPSIPNSELEKYDYNKDKKIDINDLAAVRIDAGRYNVDYTGEDGKIGAEEKTLYNSILNGISLKDSTEFVYDINGDQTIDSIDYTLYDAYINGDINLFEKVKITNDVNGDGKVDEMDLNLVKEAVANNKYSTNVDTNNDKEINVKDIISVKKAIGKFQEFSLLEQMVVSYNERVSLVVTNVPLDITLSKQAITNSKEIKGAKITIKDSKGVKVIEYISSNKPQTFAIPAGTYTLTEKIAPAGYQKLNTTVKFKVGTDGNVKLLSASSNLYKLKKTKTYGELDHLVIYNELKTINAPNTGSVMSFIEIFSGVALVGIGGYVLYRKYKKV